MSLAIKWCSSSSDWGGDNRNVTVGGPWNLKGYRPQRFLMVLILLQEYKNMHTYSWTPTFGTRRGFALSYSLLLKRSRLSLFGRAYPRGYIAHSNGGSHANLPENVVGFSTFWCELRLLWLNQMTGASVPFWCELWLFDDTEWQALQFFHESYEWVMTKASVSKIANCEWNVCTMTNLVFFLRRQNDGCRSLLMLRGRGSNWKKSSPLQIT